MARRKKQTREEKLEKKRIAARKRLENIKNDPEKYGAYKARDRARYYKKKEEKKVIPISEMTPRRKRIQRKRNRENFKAFYLRKKQNARVRDFIEQNSPPESEDEIVIAPINVPVVPENELPVMNRRVTRSQNNTPLSCPSPCPSSPSTICSSVSRSTFRRYQYKKTKIIQSLHKTIMQLKKEKLMLKKRNERFCQNGGSSTIKETSKTHSVAKEKKKVQKKIVRTLHEANVDVQRFLEDDQNSRMCPGKKDFVSKKGLKRQKRFLNDTLQNLYKKFLTHHSYRIHYGTFCRLRPFWILVPKVTARETCLCRIHANMNLLIRALQSNRIISETTPTEVVKKLTCDEEQKIACLQRNCGLCKDKVIDYQEFNNEDKVIYSVWENVEGDEDKQGIKKKKYNVALIRKKNSPLNLIRKLEDDIKPFMNHCAKYYNQSTALRVAKENLKSYECLLHIDFSENYNAKLGAEIQSMHFAGSRKQITLHTAVLYYTKQYAQDRTTQSICTLSKCGRHDAAAVWAHLIPLLKYIEENCPQASVLHIFSDSPSSQYRNRKIFYIISTLHWYLPHLQSVTWNYSESGHGKGAPDGVGGVVKRSADNYVAFGNDIPDLEALERVVRERVPGVETYIVQEYDVAEKDLLLPNKLPVFSGSMKVHQAVWNAELKHTVFLRSLTCLDADCFAKTVQCPHGKHLGYYKIINDFDSGEALPSTKANKRIKILSNVVIKKSEEPENVLGCPEADSDDKYKQVQAGSWVLVKLNVPYCNTLQIASVIEVRSDSYEVIFLEEIKERLYSWPTHGDSDVITTSSIEKVLKEPEFISDLMFFSM